MNHDDIEKLKDLSITELRRLWTERIGRGRPPKPKVVLVRELAWHAQQQVRGGIDAETRTLLRAAVRQAAASAGQAPPSRPPRPRQPKAALVAGTTLVRTWRGVRHEVTVLEDGRRYQYRDKTYRSLTQVARVITGTHWSGPRFFGLQRFQNSGR